MIRDWFQNWFQFRLWACCVDFLLDTSAGNHICDGAADADLWWPSYTTDLVLQELCGTRSGTRRQAAARCVAHKARKTLGQSATEGGGTPLVLYEQLLRFLTPTRG